MFLPSRFSFRFGWHWAGSSWPWTSRDREHQELLVVVESHTHTQPRNFVLCHLFFLTHDDRRSLLGGSWLILFFFYFFFPRALRPRVWGVKVITKRPRDRRLVITVGKGSAAGGGVLAVYASFFAYNIGLLRVCFFSHFVLLAFFLCQAP